MITTFNKISLPEIKQISPLVAAYLNDEKSLEKLYNLKPTLENFAQQIIAKKQEKIDRKKLVTVLENQYKSIPKQEKVNENIQSLLAKNTFTVTAAHQPCLFLGPLYNIYKISAAINLANQLKIKYPENHFVPIFWMGSEDHDFEELNHTFIQGKKIEISGEYKAPIGRFLLEKISPLWEEYKSLISIQNHDLIAVIEHGFKTYETFGKFTQYLCHTLFQEHGLVVIDQDDAELKKSLIPFIKDEVFNQRAQQILKKSNDWISANYKLQVNPREINFFHISNTYRERIIPEKDRFQINNQPFSFTQKEMETAIENDSVSFSPNVIYRPLYQELVLPNLAFVGGGGELSYWLQLKPLFDFHQINFPILCMRSSVAIFPEKIQKRISKLAISPISFFQNQETLFTNLIKSSLHFDHSLSKETAEIDQIFENLANQVGAIDITLKATVLAEKQKQIVALQNISAKILKAEKRKNEDLNNSLFQIYEILFPASNWQERTENFAGQDIKIEELIHFCVENLNPLKSEFLFISDENKNQSITNQ